MTNREHSNQTDADLLVAEQAFVFSDETRLQIDRICRIGKRLFDVPHCIITLGDGSRNFSESEGGIGSIEAAFCYEVGKSNGLVVVPDTRVNESLQRHRSVLGTPYLRFYASHPIYDSDRSAIGSISLIDYLPRAFSEEDGQLLIDVATLVERELQLRSIIASQLDLQKKNKNLRRKSLIDPLLGTWNRGAIMRILTIEAIRCDKMGMPLSLIVADLDYFKRINDTYGHPAGDAVLVKVASRLRSCIRPQEALGRYGGEEFLVILPGVSSTTALAVAERMRLAVASQQEIIGNATFNLTISAGIASTDVFTSVTTEELISRADIALYAAKNAGRNCVAQATPDVS